MGFVTVTACDDVMLTRRFTHRDWQCLSCQLLRFLVCMDSCWVWALIHDPGWGLPLVVRPANA